MRSKIQTFFRVHNPFTVAKIAHLCIFLFIIKISLAFPCRRLTPHIFVVSVIGLSASSKFLICTHVILKTSCSRFWHCTYNVNICTMLEMLTLYLQCQNLEHDGYQNSWQHATCLVPRKMMSHTTENCHVTRTSCKLGLHITITSSFDIESCPQPNGVDMVHLGG